MIIKVLRLYFIFFCILHLCPESRKEQRLDLEKATFLALLNNKEIKLSHAELGIKNKYFWYEFRKFLPNLNFGFNNNQSVAVDSPDSRQSSLSMGAQFLF